MSDPIDQLAADIRRIDGNHDKGAGELAEALVALGWKPPSMQERVMRRIEVTPGFTDELAQRMESDDIVSLEVAAITTTNDITPSEFYDTAGMTIPDSVPVKLDGEVIGEAIPLPCRAEMVANGETHLPKSCIRCGHGECQKESRS